MLAGSVAIHLLALLALWWFQPEVAEQEPPSAVNEVAMVFESPGAAQASTPSPNPAPAPAVAQGNPNSTNTQPSPETTAPASAPPPPPDPAPPTPAPPTPPAQVASLETPPQPQAAPQQPPQPVQPPAEPPQPVPTPSQEPPSVYLRDDSEPAFRPLPRFVMPQPPAPLPPRLTLPPALRPSPPRRFARPSPPNSSQNPFAAPQDWSLNAGPASPTPSRSARGFDMSTSPMGSQSNSNFSFVSGARPTGDWLSAFRRWAQARVYYPEEAAREGQDGVAVVMVEVERSGHVRSVKLESSARSPFLDGALIDLFRNATVPPVTSDMPDPVTMMRVQLTYHLIRH